MVFSSLTFLYVFLPVVFLLYFILPKKAKNIVLLLSGLLFYAWGEPVYVLLLILTASVDYTAGRLLDKYDDRPKLRASFLIGALVINLGLLAVFKYTSFFVVNANGLFGLNINDPKLPLPIGISFYTFQSLSYTLDMYMRKIKVQKNYLSYLTYVTLFPQIVAGPIVRYSDVANEIDERKTTVSLAGEGVGQFVRGLGKKVLLANNIGALWTLVKGIPADELPMMTAWLGILAFTFQIYFDFSGYSDMACGLGKVMGFHFPENFNYPYLSKSISEFWRRWHITLGSWFKSYVYIPLGGNRGGTAKTLRNLLVVWFLTGLWHGASWNFILWGVYYGVIIICEKLFLMKFLDKLPSFIRIVYSFFLVVMGWVLFDIDGLGAAGNFYKALFGFGKGGLMDGNSLYLLSTYALIFVLCILGSTDYPKKLANKLIHKFKYACYLAPAYELGLMLVCTAFLVNATYNPFLYFRF